MDGPRAPLESEFSHVISFLNTQLRPSSSWSLVDEYPLAINSRNISNIRVIREADHIVSSAVMRTLMIRNIVGLFKVAAIGSVVTDPQHRNKGLSHSILQNCLVSAKTTGCEFAILWTDLFDFYRKIGFEAAGTEIRIDLPLSYLHPLPAHLEAMEGANVDPKSLLRLYSQHTCGTLRTEDDIRQSLTIPNSRVYTLWERSTRRLMAFAVEGKGADLTGYIHEWGGDVAHLMSLFGYALRQQRKGLSIIAPQHAQNLIRNMITKGCPVYEGVLGMIKLLNTDNFFRRIKVYSRSLGIENLVLEEKDDKFIFGVGRDIYQTDSSSDMIRLIFGPSRPTDLAQIEGPTKDVLNKLFPMPMWVWGWDSV